MSNSFSSGSGYTTPVDRSPPLTMEQVGDLWLCAFHCQSSIHRLYECRFMGDSETVSHAQFNELVQVQIVPAGEYCETCDVPQ